MNLTALPLCDISVLQGVEKKGVDWRWLWKMMFWLGNVSVNKKISVYKQNFSWQICFSPGYG